MTNQATRAQKKRWHREDDICPKCKSGRIKLRDRGCDGVLFLGCSRFPSCKFSANIPEKPGYVYVLSNPGYRLNGVPVVKIGYTTNTLEASLKQIDTTGVPFPFKIEYQAIVWKAWATMRKAHLSLQSKRLNPTSIERDFFVCTVDEAVAAVKAAVQGDISHKAERPPLLRAIDDDIDPEILQEPDVEAQRLAREGWRQKNHTDTPGYVYVLENDVYHDGSTPLLKIGYTGWQPKDRADVLYRWAFKNIDYRGVPQPFKVRHSAHFERAFDAEDRVHKALDAFRVNPYREFFACTLSQASAAIEAELARELREREQRQAARPRPCDPEPARPQPALEPQALPKPQPWPRQPGSSHFPMPIDVPPRTRVPHPRIRIPIRVRTYALIGALIASGGLGTIYVVHHVPQWIGPPQASASTPASHGAANDQKTKKHGHTATKKHKGVRKHRQVQSAVEPDQRNEIPPPQDVDPPGQPDPNQE
jgi:hypothetical protein